MPTEENSRTGFKMLPTALLTTDVLTLRIVYYLKICILSNYIITLCNGHVHSMCTHMCMRACTCTHTNTQIQTNTHTYTQCQTIYMLQKSFTFFTLGSHKTYRGCLQGFCTVYICLLVVYICIRICAACRIQYYSDFIVFTSAHMDNGTYSYVHTILHCYGFLCIPFITHMQPLHSNLYYHTQ